MGVTVIVEGTVKADSVATLAALFKDILPDTRAYEGCRGITSYMNADGARGMLLVEQWDSNEKYENYLNWRKETGTLDQIVSKLEGPPSIRYFEAIDA